MSGNSSFYGLGQYALFGLNAPGDGLAAQFNDTTFQGLSTIGDQAFRLHGDTTTTTAVPTPALLPGLIGLGVAAFRKRKSGKVEA